MHADTLTTYLGKDYLTPHEAAQYACLPLDEFEAWAPGAGVPPFALGARMVYRKADIQAAIERTWRQSISAVEAGTHNGGRKARSKGNPLDLLPKPKPRHGSQQRSDN